MAGKGTGPLTGVRVLDLTQFESGTVCTETLAWMGAEVLKVERPKTGELARYSIAEPGKDTIGFNILNMNKKSLTCNLKTPEGLALIKKLIAKCDVMIENMGPGAIDRLGLSYDVCKEINPKLVYAQIKGFGMDGPYKDYPAFNPIATAMGGMSAVTGEPGGNPSQCGISFADSGAGYICAMSIIAALYQCKNEGTGQRVEVAMQDVIIGFGRSCWEPYYNTGKPPRRVGAGMPLEDVAPCNMYPCKPFGPNDFIQIYCSRHPGSKQWDQLCDVIGRPDLKQDANPDMATPQSRFKHIEVVDGAIKDWLKDYDKMTAMDMLCKAGVPTGAVLDCDDITKDEYYRKHGIMAEVETRDRGKLIMPGFAPRMSENFVEYKASPALGDANKEIYEELLGCSDEELQILKEKGAI